jgi:predicted hydrocarbon binding protein
LYDERVARVRGLVFSNAKLFCVDRFGESGWWRVLDALPKADRDVLEAAVTVGWYDLGVYDRAHEAIDRVLGEGDLRLMKTLGHFCAERDLTTIHRVFARLSTPTSLLTKYGEYWRRYQDTGVWTVQREAERTVRAALAQWGSTAEASCVRLAAYIEGFLSQIGAKGVNVRRMKCRARGDDVCEYLAEWKSGATA